jgi:hypothetical protein
MKTTKKQLKEIQEIEKKVAKVCDVKKTTEVTRNFDGVIINKETDKPHFEELYEELSEKERQIEVSLSYGYDAPSLKTQIKEQGFKVDMKLIVESELVKNQILSLQAIGILTKKQSNIAFEKLNDHIGDIITNSLCNENQTAIKVK